MRLCRGVPTGGGGRGSSNGNPDEISFITIDVGANDVVDACLDFDTGLLHRACVDRRAAPIDRADRRDPRRAAGRGRARTSPSWA